MIDRLPNTTACSRQGANKRRHAATIGPADSAAQEGREAASAAAAAPGAPSSRCARRAVIRETLDAGGGRFMAAMGCPRRRRMMTPAAGHQLQHVRMATDTHVRGSGERDEWGE